MRGRAVRHLRTDWLSTGVHPLAWDGLRDQGTPAPGGGLFIPLTLTQLAGRVALEEAQVLEVVQRLRQARLIVVAPEAGVAGDGFVVPEVGRLLDFLEFLEMKERFSEV